MIARIWHGKTPIQKMQSYSDFLMNRAVPDYQSTQGNKGLRFLRRKEGDEAHFLLITFWESFDAIRAFAGDDLDKAKYYPEDDNFLLEFEEKVRHYECFVNEGD